MLQKSLIYITLWLLLQLLVEINCQTTPFKPEARAYHTATYIDNKLYILGGINLANSDTNDFFYLDVSVPFNTQNLPWEDLSDLSNINNTVPAAHESATSVKGGANNNTLFLYGGTFNVTVASVYIFNPQSNSWSIPNMTGTRPNPGVIDTTGVIDNNGKMYIWSGAEVTNGTNFESNMFILDTIKLSWGNGSLNGAPDASALYGATLLSDDKIIYIGEQVILRFS